LIKDHIRDYATEAFRLYKRENGLKGYALKLKRIADDRVKQSGSSGVSKPTEMAVMYLQKLEEEHSANIADLTAVERVLFLLNYKKKIEIVKAIEYVYFVEAHINIKRCDIQDRVNKASIEIPASERNIYYWLKNARDLFAFERGLRR